MKLTIFLLLLSLFQVSANGFSQSIHFSGKNVVLEKVFAAVESQTEYVFIYKSTSLLLAKPVTIISNGMSMESFLNKVFENQSLTYRIIDKNILVAEKEVKSLIPKTSIDAFLASPEKVTVYVHAAGYKPLGNATVSNLTEKKNYLTAANGSAEVLMNKGDRIRISFIGYVDHDFIASEEIVAGKSYNVELTLSDNKLDEVQVTVLGSTNKRKGTANIATIKASDIERQPVVNVLDAIAGRVAGLKISASANTAAPRKVELRGRNVLNENQSTNPLYVIDGLPIATLGVHPFGGSSAQVSGGYSVMENPLYLINPLDIESIDVLKDADATALYGSRAANGVIMITTKRGKPGPTRFNFGYSKVFSGVQRYMNLMNTEQYLAVRREAFLNDGAIPSTESAPDLTLWDQNAYTDWQKAFYKNVQSDDVQLSVEGGLLQNTYRVSVGYSSNTEMYNMGRRNNRLTVGLSFDHRSPNNKLNVSFSSNNTYSDNETGATLNFITLAPNAPGIYDENGKYNFEPYRSPFASNYPFKDINDWGENKTLRSQSNFGVTYEVIKNLTAGIRISGEFFTNKYGYYMPKAGKDPMFLPMSRANFMNGSGKSFLIQQNLSYVKLIGGASITASVATDYSYSDQDAISGFGMMFSNDNLIRNFSSAQILQTVNNYGEVKVASILASLNFDWEGKYIVNVNGRRDGSSRFADGTRFGNFGSAGLSWVISSEDWFKKAGLKWISFATIRSTYGVMGNANVGDYQYLTRWSNLPPEGGDKLPDYDDQTTYTLIQPVNQKYSWSSASKFEVGARLGLLNNKVFIESNFYINRDGKQLTDITTPEYTGFPSVVGNWPAVIENKGAELMINATVLNNSTWGLSGRFHISRNTNKLVEFEGLEESPFKNKYRIGASVTTQSFTRFIGINPMTGLPAFEDYNGDGLPSYGNSPTNFPDLDLQDHYKQIDLSPKYFGGFGFRVDFKRALSLDAQFSFENSLVSDKLYNLGYGSSANMIFYDEIEKRRWQQPGDKALYSKYSTGSSYYAGSDVTYAKGAYVSLDNVSLSYILPAAWIQKLKMKQAQVSINTSKIFKISQYRLTDVELGNTPQIRRIAVNLRLSF